MCQTRAFSMQDFNSVERLVELFAFNMQDFNSIHRRVELFAINV